MANGSAAPSANAVAPQKAPLDASKVKVSLSQTLKDVPRAEDLVFGQTLTDHMMVVTHDPVTGWSEPEIKPYGPFMLDPASSCFQYSTSLFEGMKAYVGPDSHVRLFRPKLNMQRMDKSRARLALPEFNTDELLKLIKRLVQIESRWIPKTPGHSLYIRPTIIGTRPSLGVGASEHATLYVICCPTGPFFRTGARMLSLMAVSEHVRAWPGGTGGYKLSVNYAPTFMPQALAAKQGYDQVLYLLGDKITEAGAMNFFAVVKRDEHNYDVVTPPLDGTILPGVTRDSVLALVAAHGSETTLPNISSSLKFHVSERPITIDELAQWASEGRLLEVFAVGTAVVVASVGRIGREGKEDIHLPKHESGTGPVAKAIYQRIVDIQEGREDWKDWSVTVV